MNPFIWRIVENNQKIKFIFCYYLFYNAYNSFYNIGPYVTKRSDTEQAPV